MAKNKKLENKSYTMYGKMQNYWESTFVPITNPISPYEPMFIFERSEVEAKKPKHLFSFYYDQTDNCCGIDGINTFGTSYDKKKFPELENPKLFVELFHNALNEAAGKTRQCLMRAVFRKGEYQPILDALIEHGGWDVMSTWVNSKHKTTLIAIKKEWIGSSCKSKTLPKLYEVGMK